MSSQGQNVTIRSLVPRLTWSTVWGRDQTIGLYRPSFLFCQLLRKLKDVSRMIGYKRYGDRDDSQVFFFEDFFFFFQKMCTHRLLSMMGVLASLSFSEDVHLLWQDLCRSCSFCCYPSVLPIPGICTSSLIHPVWNRGRKGQSLQRYRSSLVPRLPPTKGRAWE